MAKFENVMNEAVQAGVIPGAILFAKDTQGLLDYSAAFSGSDDLYQLDTTLEIASLTKLITAIAALQLVEKGRLSLQQDVASYVPAFASQPVLCGPAEAGESATTSPRTNTISLERLLTHTAGAGYPFLDSRLAASLDSSTTKHHARGSVDAAYDYPLSYEPGESWLYSCSMDRVGQIIEQVSGKSLDEYFQSNIFKPLGITNASFWNTTRPPMAVRREPNGPAIPDPMAHSYTTGHSECFGGEGLVMSLQDYAKVLYSLLRNDETLLKKDTVEDLFKARLSGTTRLGLLGCLEDPSWAVGDLPRSEEYNWAIGGLVIDGDSHPYRHRNTILWSGAPSLFWFIDRHAGVCGVFGTQVLPPSDPEVKPLITAFEEEVYRRIGKASPHGQ